MSCCGLRLARLWISNHVGLGLRISAYSPGSVRATDAPGLRTIHAALWPCGVSSQAWPSSE
eukprot:5892920-Prorocentrum_lima.AAC.1